MKVLNLKPVDRSATAETSRPVQTFDPQPQRPQGKYEIREREKASAAAAYMRQLRDIRRSQ